MRPCPRCSFPLAEIAQGAVLVDHCHRCGGAFFDDKEAGPVLGAELDAGDVVDSTATVTAARSALRCPADRAPMVCCRVGAENETVDVEVCPECRGFWLDAGEGPRLMAIIAADRRARADASVRRAGLGEYLFQLFTDLPIEVYSPVRRKPRVAIVIMAVVALCYVLDIVTGRALLVRLAFVPDLVIHGQAVWGVVTHALIHKDLLHLAGNLYMLYIFGDNVEYRLGGARFALILIAAVIVGGVAQELAEPAILIGISGGVAGLFGAYAVLFPRVKLWLVLFFVRFKLAATWYFLIWLAIPAVTSLFVETNVGWVAHLGGFATGVLMGLYLRRRRPWVFAGGRMAA
jgi:membrane associated rhomboid family serine protease